MTDCRRQKAYREEEKGLLAPNFGDSAAAVASTNADAKAGESYSASSLSAADLLVRRQLPPSTRLAARPIP